MIFTGKFGIQMLQMPAMDWVWIIVLGTIATGFAFVVGVKVMEELSPFTVSLTINLEPVYGIILAFFIFGSSEKMTWGFYVGTVLILAALYMNALHRKGKIEKETKQSLPGPDNLRNNHPWKALPSYFLKETYSMSTAVSDEKKYTASLTSFQRFATREVMVGNVGIGGENPIRVQSMTTTDTMDTQKTVEQSIRMIEAGCELVRITAPSKKEAENLAPIKEAIRAAGYDTPLVADIHFTPNAAEIAAGIVEKVRVNPGNYADKKKFENIEYTDETYNSELERIRKRFTPLVLLCKENGAAMRIGTNHGSLSDRIMSRYGDTPQGMVESAMEFLRICRENDYHDIVLSMKASNCKVMVEAYRLLMVYMMREGMNYPIHLGVTEAGEGEDGRIKSAVGIGTLLEDGIGDTVRVSLTEEPEAEIPVAEMLVKRYSERGNHDPIPEITHNPIDPFEFHRRETDVILNIGKGEVPRIIGDLSSRNEIKPASLFAFGYNYSIPLDKWHITDQAADFVYVGENEVNFEIPGTLGIIADAAYWKKASEKPRYYPLITSEEFERGGELSGKLNFVTAGDTDIYRQGFIEKLKEAKHSVLILSTANTHAVAALRRVFMELINNDCTIPVVIFREYTNLNKEELQLYACDGFWCFINRWIKRRRMA